MEKTEINRLLTCILEILEMMVESGAEIYRVDESAVRVCKAYGMERVDIYATTSNIIISVEDGGTIKSHTRRVKQINTDIERVHRLNELVRNMTANTPSISEIAEEIKEIKAAPVYSAPLIFAFYGIIAGAFYLFFGGRDITELIISTVTGVLVGVISRLLGKINANRLLGRFVCSLFACLVAFAGLRLGLAKSVDHIIIGNIMTLIPGIGLTNALRDLFAGDSISGVLRIIEAALLALAIACGYIIAAYFLGGAA